MPRASGGAADGALAAKGDWDFEDDDDYRLFDLLELPEAQDQLAAETLVRSHLARSSSWTSSAHSGHRLVEAPAEQQIMVPSSLSSQRWGLRDTSGASPAVLELIPIPLCRAVRALLVARYRCWWRRPRGAPRRLWVPRPPALPAC